MAERRAAADHLLHPSRRDRLERRPAACKAATTFRSMRAAVRKAAHCGGILRDLFARDGRDPARLDYVSSPLGRARQTMELMRGGARSCRRRLRDEPRLIEIAFGEWEGFTIAQLRDRDPQRIAQREHDKWHFVPPGGESYETVAARMRGWYEDLRATPWSPPMAAPRAA